MCAQVKGLRHYVHCSHSVAVISHRLRPVVVFIFTHFERQTDSRQRIMTIIFSHFQEEKTVDNENTWLNETDVRICCDNNLKNKLKKENDSRVRVITWRPSHRLVKYPDHWHGHKERKEIRGRSAERKKSLRNDCRRLGWVRWKVFFSPRRERIWQLTFKSPRPRRTA